jgi:RNA polymerase sigma-70 factor (ECF subfamily)
MVDGVEYHFGGEDRSQSVGELRLGAGIEQLIAQARGGSDGALGQLMEHCRRYLLLVANGSLDSDLRPKVGASDLVQDTFVEAHQDFSHFQGTTERELLAWLTKILIHRLSNNVRHFRRTSKRDVEREVSFEVRCDIDDLNLAKRVTAPVQAIIARDEIQFLHGALERLPKPMRDVLVLRTWERRTFVEIAAELEGTPDSVRKMWGRAVCRLQAELREQQ